MDRKNFFKKACSIGFGSCVGFGLLSKGDLFAATQDNNKTEGTPIVPVDARQVQNVLYFIETSMDETVKESVFERLGYERTTDTGFQNWMKSIFRLDQNPG